MSEAYSISRDDRSGRWRFDELAHLSNLFTSEATPIQRFVATGICAVAGLAAWLIGPERTPFVAVPLIVISYAAGGLRATLEAFRALRDRELEINFLMTLVAFAAAAMGHWSEGAVLLFLFSLSDALERYAVDRTRRGIRALMRLRPESATRLSDGAELSVPISELRVGDRIRVRPGERFPIDGEVLEGASAVDEAILTGEPMPVDKQSGSDVFAGTINGTGSLIVRMTREAGQSTLARIVGLVEEAQSNKVSVQRVIERWQSPYVVTVLVGCAAAVLIGLIAGLSTFNAIKTAMVLLVAASPCAVVLASPVTILAAVTRGARQGVLFKGGLHLERLAAVDIIAFDKTGTVTHGKPRLVAIETSSGTDENRILTLAAALERHSEHPLAQAVMTAAAQRGVPLQDVTEFGSHPGAGVWGRFEERRIYAGTQRLFELHGVRLPGALKRLLEQQTERTLVIVYADDQTWGLLQFGDELRREAAGAIGALRDNGIRHFIMLTGDRPGPAKEIAGKLDIQDFRANMTPENKLTAIRQLSHGGMGVAMVGDGVNDAPALAAATVGIAMGGGGTDVALETADVVLMRDDLNGLVQAVRLARQTRRRIQANLLMAMASIVGLVTLTLVCTVFLGQPLPLPLAVVGHEGATVLVMLNGLRLVAES